MAIEIDNLKESHEFLRTVLDNITSAIFIVNRQIEIESFNDSFEALFGGQGGSPVGQLCGNAIGCAHAVREDRDCGSTTHCADCRLRRSLLRAFAEKTPTFRERLTREFFVGDIPHRRHFLYTTRHVHYRHEEMALIIVDDVTELEDQRLRLETLNETKNRFLGMAAHDLRNPIAVIMGYLQLFVRGQLGPLEERQKEFMLRMSRTSQNILALVNDLLDVSAIESGQVELKRREVDLAAWLESCHADNEVLAEAKSQRLVLELEPGLPSMSLDPDRMSQAINNLVTNAIKFSHPDTDIRLGARRSGGAVELYVADQGQGIPEDEQHRLFKDFARTTVQSTAGEKSTGLGLAIVSRLVAAHGGAIRVDSRPGEGTTFTIALPAG